MSTVLTLVIAISFAATLVRSTFGFGEALVAVPLFALVIPIEVAVPLAVALSILVALVAVIQDRREVQFESAKWLIVYALLGIPIGLGALVYADAYYVKLALGALIAGYAAYSLAARRTAHLERDSRAWLFACGLVSGVLGGAYGLNGPPLVVYGNLRRWSATQFRATLQAYFLPASVLGLAGYASQCASGNIGGTSDRAHRWHRSVGGRRGERSDRSESTVAFDVSEVDVHEGH